MNVSVCEVGVHALALAVAGVLAADHVRRVDGGDRAEHLAGLLDDRARLQRRRRLHRDEPEHVEQVRHDHVAVGAGVLVEPGAVVDGERLRHVDLDVVDVVAVPDRLEHAVGEPQRDQVLDRLAAEEVVDPEHALLGEHAVDQRVQLARAVEVVAERLLEHHPRALVQAGAAERVDGRAERARRDRQVVQPARLAAELRLGPADRPRSAGRASSAENALNVSRCANPSHVSPAASPTAVRATARKSSSEPPLREVPITL